MWSPHELSTRPSPSNRRRWLLTWRGMTPRRTTWLPYYCNATSRPGSSRTVRRVAPCAYAVAPVPRQLYTKTQHIAIRQTSLHDPNSGPKRAASYGSTCIFALTSCSTACPVSVLCRRCALSIPSDRFHILRIDTLPTHDDTTYRLPANVAHAPILAPSTVKSHRQLSCARCTGHHLHTLTRRIDALRAALCRICCHCRRQLRTRPAATRDKTRHVET